MAGAPVQYCRGLFGSGSAWLVVLVLLLVQ